MSTNKHKPLQIKFDQNWRYSSENNLGIDPIADGTSGNDSLHWNPIQLPHLIDQTKEEIDDTSSKKTNNWWYSKQFQWKDDFQHDDERIYLIFQSFQGQDTNVDRIDYPTADTVTIWLNGIQIYSASFQSEKLSIDLTKQLLLKDKSNKTNIKNTLIIRCKNGPLSFHASLLVPHSMANAIEDDEKDISLSDKTSRTLPLRRNRVLDYIVGFNDTDGCFDIGFNSVYGSQVISKTPKSPHVIERKITDNTAISSERHILDHIVKLYHPDNQSTPDSNSNNNSPSQSKKFNSPDIIINDDDNQSEKDGELFHVPRLTIVMLIVGTRGDVQPFVAFGQTLLKAGHRVRLATHEKFRKYVREYGLEFYPIASNPEDLMSFVVKNGGVVPSIDSILQGDLKKKRRDISDILQSTWRACTENDDETSVPFTAEVIIANPPSFGHVHCAQKLQIPLHIIFTMPWSPTTVFPHAFCKVDSSKLPREKLNILSYSIIETLTWSGMSDLVNDFRRETLDLPPLHTRQAIRILVDERVPHMYCWSPSVVPRPFDWPPHVNVAGYFFLKTDEKPFQPPDELAAFLGLNSANKTKYPPPIYIGFGSITGNDAQYLLQVVLGALKKTSYRALLSGFDKEANELPENIFKIGDTPHDWLFKHVSVVCHHGGAGTAAAGLRAGKPTVIVPFFGDQFFWGNVIAKTGAGPLPMPGKSITIDELANAFHQAHQPETRIAAERIRDSLIQEDGCANALRIFHGLLPLSRMRSDLESTFPACYRVDELDLQVSRPVAQVLVAAGALDESQFRPHATRDWQSIYDDRIHVPTRGAFKHTRKALSHVFIHSAGGLKQAVTSTNFVVGVASGVADTAKNVGKGVGHLSVGVVSLYGELTDVLDRVPSLYDHYNRSTTHNRPRVTDLESGVRAAGYSLEQGWKDGISGLVKTPRIGYRRDGLLGGAAGALVATANVLVKPTVGSLASVTWLGRGMYASIHRRKRKNSKKAGGIIIDPDRAQPVLSASDNDEPDQQDDNDDNVPANIKFASVVSGYPRDVCQKILNEFDKIKKYQEEIASITSEENQKNQPHHRFRRHRRHSDSAL